MSRGDDDDLSPFRDDPVFRALTGPATPDELAGQAEALAAFRASTASRPHRRFAARIGTSGAVAVVAVALSAGAAAAYTAELPAPVQRTLHEALGPIGVPAPTHHHHTRSGGEQTAATPGPPPALTGSPRPSAGVATGATPGAHRTPSTTPSSPSSTPVVTPPVPIAVTTPTPTPTLTRPSLVGASLLVTSEPVAKIAPGATVTVTGQLKAADGTPIEGRQVALTEHVNGEAGWTRLPTTEVTSSTGTVTFTTTALDDNARLVLRAHRHVRSTAVQVVILPIIAANTTASPTNVGQDIVTVTVTGAEQGDVIDLNWLAGGKHHLRGVLDQTGTATFTVRIPKRRTVTYHLILPRTQEHGAAAAPVTISPST